MVSPTVLARRSLCYLMNDLPDKALDDAMRALVVSSSWPTAYYLQAAALFTLGVKNEAEEAIKEGSLMEAKTNGSPSF